MHECKPHWLSQLGNQETHSSTEVSTAGRQNCVQNATRHAVNLVVWLERAKVEGRMPLAPPGSGVGCRQPLEVREIRSCTLRQQRVKYLVKPPSGKYWKMGVFVCSLHTEP